MKIIKKSITLYEISNKQICKIVLYDKNKSYGYNLFPTLLDEYYYMLIILKDNRSVVVTCLMDIHLKDKVEKWSNINIEHKYKIFPIVPRTSDVF